MKKALHRALALLLVFVLLTGTASTGFAASVGRVTKLALVSRTSTQIKLKWKAVSKADGYVAERCVAGKNKWKTAGDTAGASLTDEALKPGTVYIYRVKAYVKKNGARVYGDVSDELSVLTKPEAVSQVQMVSASSGAALVTLKWPKAAGAAVYQLFKKDATTGDAFVQAVETKKTTAAVKFPAAPGAVAFKVKAIAQAGEESLAAKFSPVLSLNLKPERVTTLTAAKLTPTSVTLVWEPADGASSYEVFLRDETNFQYDMVASVTETTYTVTDVDPSTPHYFAVKSVAYYGGNIQRTGFSPAFTTDTAFESVTGFMFVLKKSNRLFLEWNKIKSADGYEIEKSADGVSGWQQIGNVHMNAFEAGAVEPDGVLAKGKSYFYRVRAYVNENGEMKYTAYSDTLEVHPLPDAPKITRAGTASQHGICLEWTACAGAQGYEVQFFNEKNENWQVLTSSLLSAKVFKTYTNEDGVKTVYYLDRGLTTTGTYQYRVRAFVLNGEERLYSDESNAWTHKYIYAPEPDTYYANTFQQTGIGGYLYDPNEKVIFTAEDPWQRNFGFNEGYDAAAQGLFIQYDTSPVKFTCHEGEKWMIQPWKGQYGFLFYGGEIGVYRQYGSRDIEHYDCADDEDELMMEMRIYRKNILGKWKEQIHRPYGSYWWMTGFKIGFVRFVSAMFSQNFRTYPDLRVDARITMMDYDMRNAFVEAVRQINEKEQRYTIAEYGKNDLDLYISFN